MPHWPSGALTAAGTGAHLAGGTLDVLRNLAGVTGIGLLCAATLGGGLAWTEIGRAHV